MAKYRNHRIRDVTNILKALGDANRVRIVMSLLEGELCVCRVISLLGLAPSTVSKHLYILKQANLIESSKKGRWVFYRLAQDGQNKVAQKILRWLKESLAKDTTIMKDKRLLDKILREEPEQLCLRIKER